MRACRKVASSLYIRAETVRDFLQGTDIARKDDSNWNNASLLCIRLLDLLCTPNELVIGRDTHRADRKQWYGRAYILRCSLAGKRKQREQEGDM